jgi:hypothetical protein
VDCEKRRFGEWKLGGGAESVSGGGGDCGEGAAEEVSGNWGTLNIEHRTSNIPLTRTTLSHSNEDISLTHAAQFDNKNGALVGLHCPVTFPAFFRHYE